MGARLVRRPVHPAPAREWPDGARRVIDGPAGFVRILGGPGTGKTTLLAETAAARVRSGVDPERLLVLTTSRRAAESLRADITARVATDSTIREPVVRTVHSYAYAILRLQASADGLPPPRLLSSAEQDVAVRELLAGDLETGAADWPEQLRPALSVPGFAEELRDLLLRAAERGLGPDDLVKLGRHHGREQWVAAGKFWRQYEEVTLLQAAGGHAMALPGAPAYDAAELVAMALYALDSDPSLLAREHQRIRHLLVDDAQHLDPLQHRLLQRIGSAADDFLLAGDPDQSIFSFRGADPGLLADADPGGDRTVTLRTTHRHATAVLAALSRMRAGLPGPARPVLLPARNQEEGTVKVRLLPTPAAEAGWVADQLRRAHLIDEVPWSEMAVLVRSPTQSFPVLQRALRAAGVPIGSTAEELPLARQPAVRPLLTLLAAAAEPSTLDADRAELLLSSPLGGADPLALRRLRRGLRRLELAAGGERSSDELLVEALLGNDVLAGLADAEAAPVRRVGTLLATARESIARGAGVEDVLWEIWQGSGLEARLLRMTARGGSLGERADRDLDSVVALFHAAGRFVDRLPRSTVTAFTEYLSAQQIVGDSLAPTAQRSDGVALLTAHGSAGREWTVVAVVGAQEGSWPDLRLRGSLLGVERLVDLLSGVDDDTTSARAPLLAEERRLFAVAVGRARRTLLVSAVAGEDEQPSRFIDEVDPRGPDESAADPRLRSEGRGLVLAELVGSLRKAVCDASTEPKRRDLAARQLARLAAAGVPGAHPDTWYGVVTPSTDVALFSPGEVVSVSPSTVEVLARCPLRWLLERHGGSDPAQLAAVTGTLVHGLAQAAATGMGHDELRRALDEAWTRVDAGAPWFSRRERRRVEAMLENFLTWLRGSRSELTQAAVERDMSVELPAESEDELRVRLRGRVDRLETDNEGRAVIVDLKSGKVPVSAADAEKHPQLAAYQLATLLGAFGEGVEPGGARLVYVAKSNNKTGAAERLQAPLDAESGPQWLDLVRTAAASATGPDYTATETPDCPRCPARSACPLRPEGRQVTGP
ncbi:ATP-dependent helicase [Amycolatopsis suaedae]|uniref:DNA 3'-5' helicase n=1 Tax=Amycolatopsis suaedae TaxID=2510978 RepID=A0A4Q7J7U8_9PSEU|nr:ATP-dependent DNA helicase [Amycolatopsis suaedae]RZQ62872.1 ATP-dependent helicase [Amycolatopsis suaedae]